MKRILASLLVVLGLAAPAAAQINGSERGNVYYVATAGNDNNNGLSAATAWKTIAKVNSFGFQYGDTVLFNGGDTFSGSIKLQWNGGGVGAYGTGLPTISSTTSACVTAVNQHDIFVDNLICTGSGAGVNTTGGISISNTTASQLPNITVHGNTVSGYGDSGILISGNQGGFVSVGISGNTVHDVAGRAAAGTACIKLGSAIGFNNTSATVSATLNTVYNCLGHTGQSTGTGNGILIGQTNGGTIAFNIVHDYGTNNGTSSTSTQGIGVTDTQAIAITGNEIYNGITATNLPAAIFIGQDNTGITASYNWIHGNAGPGISIDTGGTTQPATNVYVSWNVLQSNAGAGAIRLSTIYEINNLNIYNNTIYEGSATAVFWYHIGSSITGQVSNNIIQTAGSTVNLTNADGTNLGLVFTNNDYTGTSTSFKQGGTTYGSFAAWQAGTGQEKISGVNVGLTISPALTNAGGGTTIGGTPPPALVGVTAYMFATLGGTPMKNVGLNVATQYSGNSIPTQKFDFYGNAVPTGAGTGYPVGANASSTH